MILPNKKQLKEMQYLSVRRKEDKQWLDQLAKEYGCSIEDAFRLYVESDHEYIYLNENFGFSINEIKVIPEDLDGGCQHIYKCSANIIKL
jgi:hypothetical protein